MPPLLESQDDARECAPPASEPAGAPEITLDALMAAVIDRAPEALRRRALLQAVDWTAAEPARVAAMLASLARAKAAPPRWLVKALLLAGHGVPAELTAAAPAEYAALNRINRGDADAASGLDRLATLDGVDPEIVRAITARLHANGAGAEAARLALAVWPRVPEALAPVRAALAAHVKALPELRARLAGFSTTSQLAAELAWAFAAAGHRAVVDEAPFGQAVAALLAPEPGACAHIILLDLDGLAPIDWRQPAADNARRVEARADDLAAAIAAYAGRASAPLLINALPVPSAPTAGLLDRRHAAGLRRAVDAVNARLYDAAGRHPCVLVADADHALADIPLSRHADPKLWHFGRIAYSAEATRALARAFAQTFTLSRRGPAKVLALDFDNTLWGGVYGDDGLERLACGDDYPGSAFRAFQQECLRLKQQGLLLVALSKNNPDAISVFERHPGMALAADDFSGAAINWRPKPGNIRELAAELNLGLDSFVFLDDSPHEREAMRRLAPEVFTPELPADPAQRPAWLRRLACTHPARLTEEDANRAQMYAASRKAQEAKASALDLGAYLASLEQRLIVERVGPAAIPRVAQMHERTNQFNLTTLRFGEPEIAAYASGADGKLAILGRAADKFGDHGVVIAATAAIDGAEAEIVTFLMSCRVIGREIETAFLDALLTLLARRGVKRVAGRWTATPKNALVRDFYRDAGFTLIEGDDRASSWALPLDGRRPLEANSVSVIMET